MSRVKVGELRPSQLIHTFGVGAVVDLPHVATIVMGLEDWERTRCTPIAEERLLAAVRGRIGSQVETLVAPPLPPEDSPLPGTTLEDARIGIPVATFPRWMRCPTCEALLRMKDGLLAAKANPYYPDRFRYVHVNCAKTPRPPPAVPARFVVACEDGHLDDFPWVQFVHRGSAGCAGGQLILREMGGGEAADVWVHCTACDSKRSMAEAFGEEGRTALPPCRGRRPHLRDFAAQGCKRQLRTILLGASNSWFPISLSALSIPEANTELEREVERAWPAMKDIEDAPTLRYLRRQGSLGRLAAWQDSEIFAAIERKRSASATSVDAGDLKGPEWRILSEPAPARNGPDFRLREVPPPTGFGAWIERVVLAERLREVTALVGFSRIVSPGDTLAPGEAPGTPAPLSRNPPTFAPASEVRGEGIFIRLDERRVVEWCTRAAGRAETFEAAHRAFFAQRGLSSPPRFPGIRYVLLHSLSHALMRQLALECGYAAASVRERIYARDSDEEDGPMAGFLLYTAAPDSEGTLGGLVSLGEPDALGRHLEAALDALGLCASDPLCAEHDPRGEPLSFHAAACHACLFTPETSCERGNRYLDRAVLVSTVTDGVEPFFAGRQP